MKMPTDKVLEGTDRVRGLARAAWARLQRSDLSDEENAAAQEEYARCRDELLELGVEVEVTGDAELKFSVEEFTVEEYDPDTLVESIDGSQDPRPLHTLTRIVDLQGFLARPVCIAIGKWATKGCPKEEVRYYSLCGMAERVPGSKLCVQHNNKFPGNNPHRVPDFPDGIGAVAVDEEQGWMFYMFLPEAHVAKHAAAVGLPEDARMVLPHLVRGENKNSPVKTVRPRRVGGRIARP